MRHAALMTALALAAPAAAQDLSLALPLDCTLGETCHIQQYVDHDPGPGATDYTCGPLSYDAHHGTDFGLPSRAAQAAGVDVLAAAPGTVLGIRDGMEDRLQGTEGAPDITGRDCGNGVLIGHEGGWETQYCHMARGSIAVAEGDAVQAGDVLGRVGLSGNTQFPHLHLSVRRDGAVVDPFSPASAESCGATGATLWAEPPEYRPGGFLSAGFADGVPDYEAVKDGTAETSPGRATPLVLWGYLFGGRAGDRVELTIAAPGGHQIFRHEETLDRTQAQLFRAAGRRAPEEGWALGPYTGTVRLLRDGAEIDRIEATTRIE